MEQHTEGEGGALQRGAGAMLDRILALGVAGFGPFSSAAESAKQARARASSREQACRSLIRTHVAAAGAQGFVTNLGGLVTLPVTLPANVGAAYLVQSHLAASIAAVYGHDPDSESVRTALLLCLLGNAGAEVVKQAGIKVGTKLSLSAIDRLPIALIRALNRKAGFMLVAKYDTKRATLTLAKGIPVLGGVVGGGVDAATTRAVGAVAQHMFADEGTQPAPAPPLSPAAEPV